MKKNEDNTKVADIAPVEYKKSIWNPRPVHQFGLDGKHIARFASKGDACKTIGFKIESLNACLKGIQKTAGGFQWRYAD